MTAATPGLLRCGPNGDDMYCPRYWELSAEVKRLRSQCDDYPELAADRDRLRQLLDEVGVLAANAPEDDAFAVCEDIAMRIAGIDAPDDGRHPDGCACQFCREDIREALADDVTVDVGSPEDGDYDDCEPAL